jgi:hypothetical protein
MAAVRAEALSTFAEREAARYEAGHLTDTERALCDVLAARRAWEANRADEAWLAEHQS